MNIILTEEHHELFKLVAEAKGVSLNIFASKALVDAARATIREHHISAVTLKQGATHKCDGLYYKEEDGEA